MLGMVHDAVLFLVEQLFGASLCSRHKFCFHKQEDLEEELPINPSGCARAEVYLRRATSLELPMAMRFRHLERTSKEAVGVYRSAIHGRGLFCKRNIDAGEMVIEYSGIVIRSVLTDKREKYYDSKTTQPPQSQLPRGLVCVSTASSVTLASYSQLSLPMFSSSHSVPPGTPAVTIVSSAHAGVQSPEVKRREVALCQPVRPAAPILINGYSAAVPVSREQPQPPPPRGRVISLNLSAPQPQAAAPALSGHTLLTVREVGGQNPDGNPQVLLVNKFGQIFVKNPTDNTFHLPGANSPSLSFIGQIKSLLQSNALASTLAASGNLSAMGGGQAVHHSPLSPVGVGAAAAAPAAVAASSSTLVQRLAPGQGPAARYLAYSSNGGGAPSAENLQKAQKKPKKKRPAPLKASDSLTKPASVSVCQSNLGQLYVQSQPTPPPGPVGVPSWTVRDPMMNLLPAVNLVAGRSTGMWSPPPPSVGPRILSATPSSGPLFRVPPALSRANALNPSAPGLLEPVPFTLAALQRPRTQVRIKRVSSLSDRISVKKSKMDVEAVQRAGLLENTQHAVSGFTSSR
ncbi:Histone-lysine N-methyltransferase 2B [Acipenser ruthenus]|uniref:Histone-lysine N-methyltransferase 2B n=1 Tax=Acipenser ruthenus TaxID=7906 RepID=A0A444UY99_ACIRT|nr:Histone-lysine N-methyltransferase 2B [Acipenser ruthenus]